MSLAGLDRKAMEEERLARLSKKRAAAPTEDEGSPKKTPKLKVGEEVDRNEQASNSTPVSPALEFPQGVIKKTWVFRHERHNDIKIEEVLQKKHLKTAVISSFNWNFEWLASKFDPQTKLIFVMQARNDKEKQILQDDFRELSKKIKLCFPPTSNNPFACMHSKLMLLFFPTHLRVCVPSANVTPYDWGETGVLENSVFLIDLPRLPTEKQGLAKLTPFAKELSRFLQAMEIHEDVRLGILNFDFTNTENIQFVHTIGGSHLGPASKHTGFPGLSRAILGLKLNHTSNADLEIDMAISSVGAVDYNTMESLYRALHGLEPVTPAKAHVKGSSSRDVTTVNPENFRIIFPSRETVRESTGGPESGGTIFLKPEYFQRPKFPAKLFRDYKSRRTGLLSHNKLIFARSSTTAFLYMGSANLSKAAWGNLTYDAATKGPKLTATNWECGVLMPVYVKPNLREDDGKTDEFNVERSGEAAQEGKVLPIDVFDRVFGVPFEYPAKPYEAGQLPWSASP